MAWLYVPESEGWNSGCTSPSETSTEPSVSWRGKPMRLQHWSRAWQTAAWLRLLSGTTLPPSTASHGVDAWMSSLRDTHVSLSAPPGDAAESMTRATSGRTLHESSENAAQLSCFARTSPAICRSDFVKSARTFKAWTTELRRECSRREKSALRTSGLACLFSLPTPSARDFRGMSDGCARKDPSILTRWLHLHFRAGRMTYPTPGLTEALMGLPAGWTAFEPVGTEWFRWQRRMLSAFSLLSWS